MSDGPTSLASVEALAAALAEAPAPDIEARAAAASRDADLTKPAGALGRLEELAIWYAGWRRPPAGRPLKAQALVFAGDHGVAARGVSPYPQSVTAQMLENFRVRGAAINQLAALQGAQVEAIDAGTGARASADFTQGPALSPDRFAAALDLGWRAVDPAAECLVLGEMGIGNTTAAAALSALILGGAPADWVGAGAGADGAMRARKAEAVARALERHGDAARGAPLEALRRVAGPEMAALAGAMARARVEGVPLALDGFVASAAALPLKRLSPDPDRGALAHAFAAHRSAEAAHARQLEALELAPLLDLGMRLGEGSGAAVALGILNAALACHTGMASFAEAGVEDHR